MGVYVYLITPGNWEALDVVARRRRPRCLTLPGVTVSIRPGGFTAMGNLIKTGFLLVVLTSLLVLVGGAIGGQQGMTIAFVLAFVMNVGSYWFSDKIVLSIYGARPVDDAQAPGLSPPTGPPPPRPATRSSCPSRPRPPGPSPIWRRWRRGRPSLAAAAAA